MPHKLQSSTLDSLVKYSHMGSILVNPSMPAVFGGNKRKGGALVKVIHAEMTQMGYGSPEW